MYRHCIHCRASLGRNEQIEHLPVGRRLAYDLKGGRLWVVCGTCRGWNLTPFAERWEALEECERAYERSRPRASSDQIALGRVSPDLDLVRIGAPPSEELAVWRWGREFMGWRRDRSSLTAAELTGGLTAAALVSIATVGPMWTLIGGFGISTLAQLRTLYGVVRVAGRVHLPDGDHGEVRVANLKDARVDVGYRPSKWRLEMPYRTPMPSWVPGGIRGPIRTFRFLTGIDWREDDRVTLSGPEAIQTLATLLPAIDRFSVIGPSVRGAARMRERADIPTLMREVAASQSAWRWFTSETEQGEIGRADRRVRLALQMAVQEEAERFALEEELGLLERAWRDAEEIAAIADNLLVPEEIERVVEDAKNEADADPTP